jgi:hypothetical protein
MVDWRRGNELPPCVYIRCKLADPLCTAISFRPSSLEALDFKLLQRPLLVKNESGRGMSEQFCLQVQTSTINCTVLLHAENLRHGTDGFNSPPKEGMLRFEPAILGTRGQHANHYTTEAAVLRSLKYEH